VRLDTEPYKERAPIPAHPVPDDGDVTDESRLARFGATLAHELRGPLAPVVNGMHILKFTAHDEQARRVLAMMERQLSQLSSLLDDLMDIGGMRSNKMRAQHERVDLHHVISTSIEACAASIDARRHELKIESEGEALAVRGDLRRLTQVFTNLLTNSNKYTPAGGHITVRLSRVDQDVKVEVIDDGMGIAPEDVPNIFDLFQQGVDHRYAAQGGLGIGLSVVKNIVQMHGGSVSAHSDGPGRGSVFTVRLPCCP
jgi:signal transduction histidine kinase